MRSSGGLITLAAVRNPIRPKNLRLRFLPIALVAVFALYGAGPAEAGTVQHGLGASLVVAGLLVRSWGAGHLTKRERLTISGPYAHHRHPLYAGTLLVATGFACALGGVVAWAVGASSAVWFFFSYFPRKERRESALLEAEFGAGFVAYRAGVPALWPRLSSWKPSHDVARSVALSHSWRFRNWSENNELGTLLGVVVGWALLAFAATSGGG